MNNIINKFKEWLVLGAWFLTMLSIWVFAYSNIQEVQPNDTLTANKFNEIVTKVNTLQDIASSETQEFFDTNEVFIWTYDALTWKKIYSKWVYFWELPNATAKNVAHWIVWIEKIVNLEKAFYNGTTFLNDWNSIWIKSDPTNITVSVSWDWRTYSWRVKMYYTKTAN